MEKEVKKFILIFRFEKAINERNKYKKFMQTTHDFNLTTKNSNFQKSIYTLPKRRMSRQSAETFNNIDFDCVGNTNEVKFNKINDLKVNHLIQKRIGGLNP